MTQPAMNSPSRTCCLAAIAAGFVACHHPPSSVTHDAGTSRSQPAIIVPLGVASGAPQFPVASLARDGRFDFAPAIPAHCTFVGAPRHLMLADNAPAVFVTAASAGRSLLALGAALDGDGGASSVSDGATW